MPFVKFEATEAAKPQVKINNTTIVFSEKAWNDAGLNGADHVNLWWDAAGQQIGISSTDTDDRSKFSIRTSRRGVSVPAKGFFERFHLTGAQPSGSVYESDGVVAFKVAVPGGAPTGDAPRRRGRRPKNLAAA